MHGHCATDCASGAQGRAPSVAGSVAGSYRGGFNTVGSQSLYTAHSTGRTYDIRRDCTHVLGADATTWPWAGRARHRLPRPPSPFRPGRPRRRPTAEGPSASGGERPASGGGADEEGGGALNLRYAGSAVDSLWWGNYMEEPLALAIRRWSPGTV